MSNYFQTLNRLERERGNARATAELETEDPTLEIEPLVVPKRPGELGARAATEGRHRAPVARGRATTSRQAANRSVAKPVAEPAMAPAKAPARKHKTKSAPQRAALDRAEAARAVPVTDAAPSATPVPEPARTRRRIAKQSLLDARTASGDGHTPYLKLFDNLRARAAGETVHTVVLAGAGLSDTPTQVTSGLATLARRRSLKVLVADVEEGMSHPVLNPRNRSLREQGPMAARAHDPAAAEPYASSIALNLRGGPVPADLQAWLESAEAHHDLVIVEAPPLGHSVDAALLARACDGLVIVVDPAAITKDTLRRSVERAQTIGCRILGLVMTGKQSDMPGWMGRMTGARADV